MSYAHGGGSSGAIPTSNSGKMPNPTEDHSVVLHDGHGAFAQKARAMKPAAEQGHELERAE